MKKISAQPDNPVFDLNEIKPEGTELNLGPAPRQTYPLVLCCMTDSEEGNSPLNSLSILGREKYKIYFYLLNTQFRSIYNTGTI